MSASFALLLTPLLALSSAWADDAPQPLSDAEREIFFGTAEDARPEKRERAATFWAGNEDFLYVFEPDLADLGGGFMGVGSDQNYLFIGWQRPELAWLTDYDDGIQRVHRMHRALFLQADSPDAFVELWGEADAARKHIAAAYAGEADLDELLEDFDKAQPYIHRRLRRVRKGFQEANVDCYLTDQADYDFLVAMWRAERIRPLLGNLLDAQALVGVADAATRLEIPIRVVYLSNAEQYWDYPEQFRTNFTALGAGFDDRSIVIRTIAHGTRADDYDFNVQPAHNFVEWLGQSRFKNVYKLQHDAQERHGRPFSYSRMTVAEYDDKHDRSDDIPGDESLAKKDDKRKKKKSRKKANAITQ